MTSPERISVEEARDILRTLQLKAAKKHSRVHKPAMVENAAKIRALEGCCGRCSKINPERTVLPIGEEGVSLKCRAHQSPTFLHLNTPLGVEPKCDHFKS